VSDGLLSQVVTFLVGSGLVAAIFGYLQFRQKLNADKAVEDQDEETKIVALMVDSFKSIQAQAGTHDTDMRTLWAELQKAQIANLDCQRKVMEAEGNLAAIKLKLADFETLIKRWQKHTGLEAPP